MGMKAALYVCTSTGDQTVPQPGPRARGFAERLAHGIVEVDADNGISGAKGLDRRHLTVYAATPRVSLRQLARQFGVGRETVRRLLCGGD
jgi:hypothetical protein